jgi:hypothetical protein
MPTLVIIVRGGAPTDDPHTVAPHHADSLERLQLSSVGRTAVASLEHGGHLAIVGPLSLIWLPALIERLEVQRIALVAERRHVAGDVAADRRVLHLEDIGAEVGEHLRSKRARAELRDREDAEAGERSPHHGVGLEAICPASR